MKPQKIEVIAAWDTGGGLWPLRFRFEGADHQLHRVDIDQVLSTREVAYAGVEALVYLCRAQADGRERVFELKYTIRTHSWQLCRWVY